MTFSASTAALEGFRIIGRDPRTFLVWTLMVLVAGAAMSAVMLPLMGPLIAMTAQRSPLQPLSPSELREFFPLMGRAYAIMIPTMMIYYAIAIATVYRAVLRPDEKRFARVRLGADELRLIGLWILLGLVFLGGYLAALLIVVIVAVALVFVLAAAKVQADAVSAILIVIMGLGMVGAYAWAVVRLSLAGPMTFDQKRIVLFKSWALTKGRFWPLFGCYLITFALAMVIYAVMACLFAAVAFASGGGSWKSMADFIFRPDVSSLQAYLTPARIVLAVAMAPVSAVFIVVCAAPPAAAYRAIMDETWPAAV